LHRWKDCEEFLLISQSVVRGQKQRLVADTPLGGGTESNAMICGPDGRIYSAGSRLFAPAAIVAWWYQEAHNGEFGRLQIW
jgi:hypothetical protein